MNHFKFMAVSFCLMAGILVVQGCDKQEPAAAQPASAPQTTATPTAPAPVPAPAPAAATPPAQTLAPATAESPPAQPVADSAARTPEALEELLAPVALYPDGVLAQVLVSSTKPQEVLDGGNWLLKNGNLKGAELEKAAQSVGFTPPMIALMQFPSVLDMMCMKMEWTTELGAAYLADEPGVLAAVQRLRKQAAEMGNLKDSGQLKVENVTVNNQDVITVKSPDPKVVYVPQYDPVTTYTTPAPVPAAAAPTATTPATTSTTVVNQTEGHSTAALVTTGLLAFGAGILVNEAFDDDDDDYWGGGYGYPPPYYPVYGNGYGPSYKYNNNSNNNIYINNGKNDYWNRFDHNGSGNRQPRSPISDAQRRPADWKGKGSYDGAGARPSLQDKAPGVADRAARQRIEQPTGSYAGATKPTRTIAGDQNMSRSDRGRQENLANQRQQGGENRSANVRPTQQPMRQGENAQRQRESGGGALQGLNNKGGFERTASARGKASRGGGGDRAQRSGGGRRR